MPGAIVISVGDELLAGRVADSNAQWASVLLRQHGFPVVRRVTVSDQEESIASAVTAAFESASVVVVGGGLGPTLDDITRDGLARAFGVALRRDSTIVDELSARSMARGRPITESNLRQADVPDGFSAMPNSIGTAPALLKSDGSRILIAVAGVPAEFRSLLETHLVPRLATLPGRSGVPAVGSVTLCSIPESEIGERLKDLMRRGRDPEIGSYPSSGPVTLVVTSWNRDDSAARRLVDSDIAEIKLRFPAAHLSDAFASLAAALVSAARSKGLKVAVAESLTGGLVTSMIVDVPHASEVLVGGMTTYANASKVACLGIPDEVIRRHGVVSREVALAMAEGVRASLGADLSVSTTGVAGPDAFDDVPVGTVWFGLAWRGGAHAIEVRLSGSRAQIRTLAAARAVDLMRRYVAGVALSGP